MDRPSPFPMDVLDRLERCRQRCARVPGLLAAVVFGSFARGEATPWSDVDVGVLCEGSLDFDERLALLADLGATLERDVDVVDLRNAPLPLRGRAVADAAPLVLADREAWIDFVTRTTLEWLDFKPTYLRGVAIELERFRSQGAA